MIGRWIQQQQQQQTNLSFTRKICRWNFGISSKLKERKKCHSFVKFPTQNRKLYD